jgi:hypothetical protein
MNEIETDVVTRPVFQSSPEKPARRGHDKKSLLVFFSFVAALVVLVALNMK